NLVNSFNQGIRYEGSAVSFVGCTEVVLENLSSFGPGAQDWKCEVWKGSLVILSGVADGSDLVFDISGLGSFDLSTLEITPPLNVSADLTVSAGPLMAR
ncbi:MAG: hypothetical protein GY929_12645, partial [Actinomycetia bacterium]|nr:hypothetical protein [Actinomycetes bacterium]